MVWAWLTGAWRSDLGDALGAIDDLGAVDRTLSHFSWQLVERAVNSWRCAKTLALCLYLTQCSSQIGFSHTIHCVRYESDVTGRDPLRVHTHTLTTLPQYRQLIVYYY